MSVANTNIATFASRGQGLAATVCKLTVHTRHKHVKMMLTNENLNPPYHGFQDQIVKNQGHGINSLVSSSVDN